MIKIEQKIIDRTKGDCFRACLVSLLEDESVPTHDNAEQQSQFGFYNDWLESRNLQLCYIPFGSMPLPKGLFILSVKSACFENCTHVVIARENLETGLPEVLWNPNPSDQRGNDIPNKDMKLFYLLAVIDPLKTK